MASVFELVPKFPGKSLLDFFQRAYPDRRDPEHLLRLARRGKLSPAMARGISTTVHLTILSHADLGLSTDVAAYRETVLITSEQWLREKWLPDLIGLLNAAVKDSSWARVAQLAYVLSLARYRLSTFGARSHEELLRAVADALTMEAAAGKASSELRDIWKVLPQVNRTSFSWQMWVGRPITEQNREEFLEMLRVGRAACRNAAEHHGFWVGVRRDEIEHTGQLIAHGDPIPFAELDTAIYQLARPYRNSQVNYVVRLMHDNMEPLALKCITDRPIYQLLIEACKDDPDNSLARVTDDLLKNMHERIGKESV